MDQLVCGRSDRARMLFLEHLLSHLLGLLITWDSRPQHRSRLVRQFVASQWGRIASGYAPKLKLAEHIWALLKQHELPDLRPKNLTP